MNNNQNLGKKRGCPPKEVKTTETETREPNEVKRKVGRAKTKKLNKENIETNTAEYSEEAEENDKPTSLDPRGKKKKQRKQALPNRSQWTRFVVTFHGIK